MNFMDEFAIDIEEFDMNCRSLFRAYEMTELKHQDMLDRADFKLLVESGTYEDAMFLYEEANKETEENKQNIFKRLWEGIKSFFRKIKEFFTGKPENQIDPNKKYDTKGGQNVTSMHDRIDGLITDIKGWIDRGFKDIPESVENAAKIGSGIVAAVGVGSVAGSTIKSVYAYAKGDTTALYSIANKLQQKIDEMDNVADVDKTFLYKAKEQGLKAIHSALSTESKFINNLVGKVFGKIETSAMKAAQNKEEKLENDPAYIELTKKEENGTITVKEQKKLDKMKAKLGKVTDKKDKHTTNVQALSNVRDLGKLTSNTRKLVEDMKRLISDATTNSNISGQEITRKAKLLDRRKESLFSIFNAEKSRGDKSRIKSEQKELSALFNRYARLKDILYKTVNDLVNSPDDKQAKNIKKATIKKHNADIEADQKKHADGGAAEIKAMDKKVKKTAATEEKQSKRRHKKGAEQATNEFTNDWFDLDIDSRYDTMFESCFDDDDELLDIISEL